MSMIVSQAVLNRFVHLEPVNDAFSISVTCCKIAPPSLAEMEHEWLHDVEKESYVQKAPSQQLSFLLGRLSAKELLQKRIGGPLNAIPIITSKKGPFCPLTPDLSISISHSGMFGAACVSKFPIGVDIETIRPRSPSLASFTFHDEESTLLQQWNVRDRAVIGWSMKEACHKALRTEESFCPHAYTISQRHGVFFAERDSVCWQVSVTAMDEMVLSLAQKI
jgi:phosphopantetheinyl transferase